MSGFPSIESLVPHADGMLLVGAVLEHTEDTTVCRIDVARSALFCDALGRVPAYVALEYMAQTVAAHGGLCARERGESPRVGLLLRARDVRLRVGSFGPDRLLRARARVLRAERLLSFACDVSDPADARPLACAEIKVHVPDALELPRAAAATRGRP